MIAKLKTSVQNTGVLNTVTNQSEEVCVPANQKLEQTRNFPRAWRMLHVQNFDLWLVYLNVEEVVSNSCSRNTVFKSENCIKFYNMCSVLYGDF